MARNNFSQVDLRYLLPVHPGQRVLVIGDVPVLVTAMENTTQVVVMEQWETGTPLPAHNFHHVFIPRLTASMLTDLTETLETLLVPGGWACLGVRNAQRLQRLRFWKRAKSQNTMTAQLSYQRCKRLVPGVQSIYGLHDNLSNPQFFVPLDDPLISQFFVSRLKLAVTRSARIANRLLQTITRYGLHPLLFNDFAVIVQVSGDSEHDS